MTVSKTNSEKKKKKKQDPETCSSENVTLKINSFFDGPEDFLDSVSTFFLTVLFELKF